MNPKFPLALLGALTLAATGHAQMVSPASSDPAAAQSGSYAVEPNHTRVQFAVSHMGFTDWYGDFTGVSGQLSLDAAAPAHSSVDITIPTASVVTTNAKLDGELRGAAWLDADKFPQIHFVSTKVVRQGKAQARIFGDLTLHGVTRPVVLDASFNGAGVNPMSKGTTVGFNATASIKRSDFGVATYIPLIGDEVNIRISAAFERKGA